MWSEPWKDMHSLQMSRCLDGGTGGFILLEPLQNAGHIILIDATDDGNPPGTVTRTTPRFPPIIRRR